jgi:predicted ATPase/class 3 adenylate cyclase
VNLNAFIPLDRLQALTYNRTLPEQAYGSILIADISDFTPLTEAFVRVWGIKRGAEELTRQLNRIYDALIDKVYRYGGSVIGFSGDGITCWFEGQASSHALQSAVEMRRAMQEVVDVLDTPTSELMASGIKIAVATGMVRRFLVGDPEIRLIDVPAGRVVSHAAEAEQLTNRNEIVADSVTAAQSSAIVSEWRLNVETQNRYAVIKELTATVDPCPQQVTSILAEHQARSWLLPAVYERLSQGLGEFVPELRLVVAVFLNFNGIDYDNDPQAGEKLNEFVAYVQHVLARYDASLIQLTVGDKGSYLYAAFGAPVAYEDSPLRAVSAALELIRAPFDLNIRIGMSQGIMRTGVYGATTCRTYGVLGDEANLAARLMQIARDREILGSGRIQSATNPLYQWEDLPSIQLKGKSKLVPIARLVGKPQTAPNILPAEQPLVGRVAELAALQAFIQPIFDKQFAGLAYIYGEPGIGKTHLVHALHERISSDQQVQWYTFRTDSLLPQSLHPFVQFLREYFQQSPQHTEAENKEQFESALAGLSASSEKLETLKSFLAALINLSWKDSPYEQADPKERFEQTLIAFKTLIEAECRRMPVILYLDNAETLDKDSRQLLESLLDKHLPLALLISSRYYDDGLPFSLEISDKTPQLSIQLNRFSQENIEVLASELMNAPCSPSLVAYLATETNGNPFFCEQLLFNLRERSLLTQEASGSWTINRQNIASEVPLSLNMVLVARLDRLKPKVNAVVRMATVLGETFELAVLLAMGQENGRLMDYVQEAEREGIWLPISKTHQQFRHSLLRSAAYDMQERTYLHELHQMAAAAIQAVHATEIPQYASELAFHYGQAEDSEHEYIYSRIAGENAATRFANTEAISYLERALMLAPSDDTEARFRIIWVREGIYDLLGERTLQREDLDLLTQLAQRSGNSEELTQVALRKANLAEVTGNYQQAAQYAQEAIAMSGNAPQMQASAYLYWGRSLGWQADYQGAREQLEKGRKAAQEAQISAIEADCLRNLGIVAYAEGSYYEAESYQHQALRLSQHIADRRGESNALNNLGILARALNDLANAQSYQEQALRLSREIGDRRIENSAMLNLGSVILRNEEFEKKWAYFEDALRTSREIGNRRGEIMAVSNLGGLAMEYGDFSSALVYYWRALQMCQEIGFRRAEGSVLISLGALSLYLGDYGAAHKYGAQGLQLAQEIGDRLEQAQALPVVGNALFEPGKTEEAAEQFQQALVISKELNQHGIMLEALAGLANVAFIDNDLLKAHEFVEEILLHNPRETRRPLRIYLICYKIFYACQDQRAAAILDEALALLQELAARIGAPEVRRAFVEDVPEHRELLAARVWTAHA